LNHSVAKEDRFDDHAFAAHLLEETRASMKQRQLDDCETLSSRNHGMIQGAQK
jgi:hypothetical protein